MKNSLETSMTLSSVGIIRNEIKTPYLKAANQGGITLDGDPEELKQHVRQLKHTISRIEIYPKLSSLLTGIDQYSHLVILYWAHKVPQKSRVITMVSPKGGKVHPMGCKENPKVGIFCTASPVRPNPILTTVVTLEEVRDTHLLVRGLDAVDRSPVLDIKPYVPAFYPEEETRIPDWMTRIMERINS